MMCILSTNKISVVYFVKVGDYHVFVNFTSSSAVEYNVRSLPTGNDTIRILSALSMATMDFADPEIPKIFAQVVKGASPVIDAEVEALVQTNQASCTVPLKDNGIGTCSFSSFCSFYFFFKFYTYIFDKD